MKNLFKTFIIISIIGCSSSRNSINSEPGVYKIENDDGTITKVRSDTIGKLTIEKHEILNNHLSRVSDFNINFTQKVVINFIDNDPRIHMGNYQVPWDIFYGNIEKELAEIDQLNHFWIINERVKDLYYYHGNKISWIVDKDNTIRDLFFKYEGLNGGFVIIKPNGDYFLKVGEYQKSDVLKMYKEF